MTLEAVELDHLAVAAEHLDDLLHRYAGDLAGTWWSGGGEVGFTARQFAWSSGPRLETIAPVAVEVVDFLRRYLDRHGPGPHHLTFKVPDVEGVVDAVTAAGYPITGLSLDVPGVEELFVAPAHALGTVVQLVGPRGRGIGPPDHWPSARVGRPADFLHVGHEVASTEEALALYQGLLGAEMVGRGTGAAGGWVEVGWPAGGRIRVIEVPGERLGGRRGRIAHAAFAVADPGGVAGAQPTGDGSWAVPTEANHGVRLVLTEPG